MSSIIAKIRAYLIKKMMAIKDERMRNTTEAINNVKIIKFYAWKDLFINNIFDKRNRELYINKIEAVLDSLGCFIVWVISPALIISTFFVFFQTGNTISIGKAFAAIQVFSYLELPVRRIPEFIKSFLEFTISMQRIQRFLK